MAEMFCQQCRTPLKLHGSLQNLSPAAISLLNGSSSSTASSKQTAFEPRLHSSTNVVQNPSRREIYELASKNDAHPVTKRSFPNAPKTSSPLATGALNFDPTESFVVLSDSVILKAPQVPIPDVINPTMMIQQNNNGINGGSNNNSGNNAIAPEDSLSHKMQTQRRLFDVLSARSDVDYPICSECTEMLVESLQKRLADATRSRDGYQQFLKKLQAEVPSEEEVDRMESELSKVKKETEAALAELEELEREKEQMEQEIAEAEAESKRLEEEEEVFWQERNSFAQQLEEFQSERDSINLRYDHDAKQFEKLQRTNVYNDTFCIGHDGFFGTINGLRLGKLPSQPVDWPEINAAWGQTLLLLYTVANKIGFVFENYRLKPMGSTSKIEKIEQRNPDTNGGLIPANTPKSDLRVTSLELFSSGTIPMGHLFAHRKFDGAMVAFIDCIKQLGEFVAKADPTAVLPYTIVKDKIGDVSIRLTFNQDETWTKACKYTLTCTKFLLAYASKQGITRRAVAQPQIQQTR